MRFMMHMHGFTLNEDAEIEPKPKKQSGGFMFQDPSMYEDMTREEKEAETKRMMGMHKQWATGKSVRLGVS